MTFHGELVAELELVGMGTTMHTAAVHTELVLAVNIAVLKPIHTKYKVHCDVIPDFAPPPENISTARMARCKMVRQR